ncbi:MAG TPA: hypothetical protein PLN18_01550 [Candidatus Colwellbacteria bacterium]|nr:hypothetical protein [Candidatus Colwellbacteria bacterium]
MKAANDFAVEKQVEVLRSFFPKLKEATFDESITLQPLPEYADLWVAFPRWQAIAGNYTKAVKRVIELLRQKAEKGGLSFYDNYGDKKDSRGFKGHKLYRHKWAADRFQLLTEQQKGHDILIAAVNFLTYRSRNARYTRLHCPTNAFGLGAFEVGAAILALYPEYFSEQQGMYTILCCGDREQGDEILYVPEFHLERGRYVAFYQEDLLETSFFCTYFGSALAFLPVS